MSQRPRRDLSHLAHSALSGHRNQVRILPTSYEQLFGTKVNQAAFLYKHLRFVLFVGLEGNYYNVGEIDYRLPRNVRPLCNSVLIHIVVACLYNIISRVQQAARKEKVAREKLDFLIAFGEALNNLDPGVII